MKKNVLVLSVSSILALASCGKADQPQETSIPTQEKSSEAPVKSSDAVSSNGTSSSSANQTSSQQSSSTKTSATQSSSSKTDSVVSVEQEYRLELDFAGGEAFDYDPTIRPSDAMRRIENPVWEGHVFLGWQKNGTGSRIKGLTIPAGTKTNLYYVACWEVARFTLTLDYDTPEGELVRETLEYGSFYTLPGEIYRDGYQFRGWVADNGDYYGPSDDVHVTSNLRLTAQWEENPSEITYELNGGENHPDNASSFDGGGFTLLNPSREGYEFMGWSTEYDSEPLIDRYADPNEEARTFIANWEPLQFHMVAIDEASGTQCFNDYVSYDRDYSIREPLRPGYDLLGWRDGEGNLWESRGNYQYSGDVILIAQWQIHEYQIQLDLGGGVAGENYPSSFTCESPNISFSAPTRDGYLFKGWSVNGQIHSQDDVLIPTGSFGDVTITALWLAPEDATTYTIYFDTDGGGELDPITVIAGMPVGSLPTPQKTGWEFKGWQFEYYDFDPSLPFEYDQDITLKASYSVILYSITWDVNGGTLSTPNTNRYNYGMSQIYINQPTKEGYTFLGWKDQETGQLVEGYFLDVTGQQRDIVMVAVYAEFTYSINFYTDYGSGPNPITGLTYGDSFTLPTLEYAGYDFLGWEFYDGQLYEATTFEYHDNLYLRARWQKHAYQIRYEIDGATNDPNNPTSYTEDDWFIVINAPGEKAHYEFRGWKLEGDETGFVSCPYQFYGNQTKKDVTFIAVYEKKRIYVNCPYEQGIENQLNTSVAYGEAYEFTAPSKKGYRFMGWKKEDGTEFPSKGIMTEESSFMLYPVWALIEYAIHYDLDGGTPQNDAELPQSYNIESTDVTIPSFEKFGYAFTGWYVNGAYTWGTSSHGYSISDNIPYMSELVEFTVKPSFYLADYELRFDADGGTLSENGTWVTHGDVVDLPTPTKDGVVFSGWYLDGVLVKSGEPYLLGKGGTLVAHYEVGVAYDLDGGVNAVDNPLLYGDTPFALSDPTREGYEFLGWTTEGGETPTRGYIVDPSDRSKTYTAHWLGHQHTLTFSTRDGTPIEPMSVRVGDNIDLPVAECLGYSFVRWQYADENGVTRTLNSGVYNLDTDLDLYALFSEVSYPLVYELGEGGINASSNHDVYYSSRNTQLYAPTRTHYDFVGWTIVGEGGDPNPNLILERGTTGIVTLEAHWTPHEYTMSLYYNDGSPRRDYIKLFHGDHFDLPDLSRPGWTFLGWYYGNTKVESGEFDFTNHVGLTARWEAIEYSINYNLVFTDDSVNASSLATKYSAASSSSVGTPSRSGWVFLGWSDEENPNIIQRFYNLSGKTGNLSLKAHWRTDVYYDYTDDEGTHLASFEVRYGEEFAFPQVPCPTGKIVSGWVNSSDNDKPINSGTWTITDVYMAVLRLKALYEDDPYAVPPVISEIHYEWDGGCQDGPLSDYPISYEEGTASHVIGAGFKTGYDFVRWEIYDEQDHLVGTLNANESLSSTFTGNLTLKPVYTPKLFTVRFERQDGSLYGELTDVPFDSVINLPSGDTEGYTLRYWIKNRVGYYGGDAYKMTDPYDILFIGYYDPIPETHTITYVMNGGVNSEINPSTYDSPRSSRYIYLDVPQNREGYIFRGWSRVNVTDPSQGDYITNIDSEEKLDYVLYAIWEARSYVGYLREISGSSYQGSNVFTFRYEQNYVLPTNLTRNGYTFLGWYTIEDGQRVDFPASGIWKQNLLSGLNIYAAWRADVHPISYQLDGGRLEGDYATEFAIDHSVSLPTPKKDGYTFLGWSFEAEGEPDKNLRIQHDTHFEGVTVYAHWRDDRITVGLVVGDAVLPSGTAPVFKMVRNTPISLPTPSRGGYQFLGWYDSNNRRVNDGDIFTYYESVTLTARWEAIRYSINNNLNLPAYYTVETPQTALAYPENIPTGWHFSKWKVTYEDGRVVYYDEIIPNVTFARQNVYVDYVREKNVHTVTFIYKESADGPEMSFARTTQSFAYGDSFFVEDSAPATYSLFYYYFPDALSGTKVYYPGDHIDLSFDSDVEIIVVLNKVFTTVHYSNLKDGMVFDGAKVMSFHPSQGTITIPNLTMDGYTFQGWRVYDANGVVNSSTPTRDLVLDITEAGEITLTAVFDGISYPVVYDLGDGNGYRSEYFLGDTITFTEPTRFGYTFAGWAYNGRLITDVVKMERGYLDYISEEQMQSGITFVATWTPLQYGIATSYDGGVPADPNAQPQNFRVDSSITLVEPVKKGYEFLGYNSEINDVPTKTLDAATTMKAMQEKGITTLHLQAVYQAKQTVVTFTLNEGETLLGAESYILTYDAPFTLPSAAKTGYTFAQWGQFPTSGEAWNYDGVSLSLSASWTANTYTLTVQGVNTSKEYEMTYAGFINIDFALEEEGYSFVNYTTLPNGQGEVFAYQQPAWLYAENRTIYANYTRQVSFVTNGGNAINPMAIPHYGAVPDEVVAKRSGYTFDGWFTDPGLTKPYSGASDFGPLTLYARYAEETPTSYFTYEETSSGIRLLTCTYDGEEIVLPTQINNHTVVALGERVFANLTNLKRISIPSSVTEIGQYAFDGCTSLESLDLPALFGHTIGYYFSPSTNDSEGLYVGGSSDGSTKLPTSLTYVSLGLRTLAPYAFYGASSLTRIDLGWRYDGATHELTIPEYCFAGCTNLSTVFRKDGQVEQEGEVRLYYSNIQIGDHAFENCASITAFYSDSNHQNAMVTSVGDYAFAGCTSLHAFDANDRLYFGIFCQSIGTHAFEGCDNFTAISAQWVSNIANEAFYGLSKITSITTCIMPEKGLGQLFRYGTSTSDPEWTLVGSGGYAYLPTGLRTVILDKVTEIPAKAFYNMKNLESLSLYDIAVVGESAFEGCLSYSNRNTMPHATSIGARAFYGCALLKQATLEIPQTASIGNDAFYGCEQGSDLTVSASTVSPGYVSGEVSTLTLLGNLSYDFVKLFPTTKTIAFETYPVVRDGVTYYVPKALKRIVLRNITEIPASMFKGFSSIREVFIPNNLTQIGDHAFEDCTSLFGVDTISISYDLNRVSFPSTLLHVGAQAFKGCASIREILGLDALNYIGEEAFAGCTGVERYDGQYRYLSLTNENRTYLGDRAFADNPASSIILEASVTTLGDDIFEGSTALRRFTTNANASYFGDEIPATLRYLTLNYDVPASAFANKLRNEVEVVVNGTIASEAFLGCSGITYLSGAVTRIGDRAFLGCTGLLRIGQIGVSSIGDYAFQGCTGLMTVPNDPELLTIGDYAFQGCTSVSSVYLGENLQSVGDHAFDGCTGLKRFTENNVTATYGDSILSNVSSLKDLVWKRSADFATLFGNSSDTSLYYGISRNGAYIQIPNSLERIDYYPSTISEGLFRDLQSVTTIHLWGEVTDVPAYAFYGCSRLENMTGLEHFQRFGDYAFYGCYALRAFYTYYDKVYNRSAHSNFMQIESIGTRAFYGVCYLPDIFDFSYLKSLSDYAFEGSGLRRITISSSLQLGIGVLKDCDIYELRMYQIPDGGLPYLFYGNESSSINSAATVQNGVTYYFPAMARISVNVDTIPDHCFEGIKTVQVWEINGAKTIGAYAFANASVARQGTNAGGYAEFDTSSITSIGDFAFAYSDIYTTDLRGVATLGHGIYEGLPIPLLQIGELPEDGLATLFSVTQEPGFNHYSVQRNGVTYYIPSDFKTIVFSGTIIPSYAFAGFTSLSFFGFDNRGILNVPSSVAQIGAYAFAGTQFDVLKVDASTALANNAFADSNIVSFEYNGTLTTTLFADIFGEAGKENLQELTLHNVSVIPASCFRDMSLNNLTINGNITYIGDYAFYHCVALNLHFGSGDPLGEGNQVTYIGEFSGVGGGDIYLSPTLTHLGNYAFGRATSLHFDSSLFENDAPIAVLYGSSIMLSLYVDGGLGNIDYAKLVYGQGAVLPAEVQATYDHNHVHDYSLYVTGNDSSIPANRFKGDTHLTDIHFENPVTQIGDHAFDGCSSLHTFNGVTAKTYEVRIEASATSIGAYAFRGTQLQTLTLNGGNPTIGEGAFACSQLKYIRGCGNLTVIPAHAFEATHLYEVDALTNVVSIGACAFYDLNEYKLATVEVGDKLESIGDQAFDYFGLQYFYLPRSVTSVGSAAFDMPGRVDVEIQQSEKTSDWASDWFIGNGYLHLYWGVTR